MISGPSAEVSPGARLQPDTEMQNSDCTLGMEEKIYNSCCRMMDL